MVQAGVADPDHLLVHYRRADGEYRSWSLYAWGDIHPGARTDWPAGQPFSGEDQFGGYARVRLRPGARSVGFLVVDADGVKDVVVDRSVDPARYPEIWLRQGDPEVYTTPVHPADLTRSWAYWIDRSTVAWPVDPAAGYRFALVCAPEGGLAVTGGALRDGGHRRRREIRLRPRPGGLTAAQRRRYPHLSRYPAFRVEAADPAVVAEVLRGQVVAASWAVDGTLRAATGVQVPGVLDGHYSAASSATLGVVFRDGRPTVAVWAPTARGVTLELSPAATAVPGPPDAGERFVEVAMVRDDTTGVWSVTGDPSWAGRYYRFRVVVWHPDEQAVTTARVTDPYSLSLSTDSRYSQLVDLADPALAPEGWAELRVPAVAPAAVQVHELSVRDFSIADATVPAGHRGRYLAFTHAASEGMSRLRELAAAGVTHVELMPVFDFASVPDRREDQREPPGGEPRLADLAPDSEEQQALVERVADVDGYDWGYDPWHLTVPEGSYATDPEGTPRIVELRRAVAALAGAGLGTVLDVAYNHTCAAGTGPRSVLDRIVPGYYHRRRADGTVETSTGGANTAPEHAMMGKLVVDSVVTWARRYKVAGFRFDLMGHHPRANLLAVRAALDALTPAADGVDGRAVLLWGEGWNTGEVANDARFVQATQANLAGTGIGTFNDRLRDAVRGGRPSDGNPRAQGFASGLFTDPNGDPVNGSAAEQLARLRRAHDVIQVGLAGNLAGYRFIGCDGAPVTGAQVRHDGAPAGYTASPAEAVTYVDSHDNEILYDALAYKLPARTRLADRVRMHLLALSFTVFGQGVGFVTGGSDRLRSKSLDGNSYRSGDWFNAMLGSHQGNGFGRGLPMRRDNGHAWRYARPLLADPALVPDHDTMLSAAARYRELVRIATGSPLFSLGSAREVQRRLWFPLAGPRATPGVITMLLDGSPPPTPPDPEPGPGLNGRTRPRRIHDPERLDPRYRALVTVFNATPRTVRQRVPALVGAPLVLHPLLVDSVDPVVRTAAVNPTTGALVVPARTVAVFVLPW